MLPQQIDTASDTLAPHTKNEHSDATLDPLQTIQRSHRPSHEPPRPRALSVPAAAVLVASSQPAQSRGALDHELPLMSLVRRSCSTRTSNIRTTIYLSSRSHSTLSSLSVSPSSLFSREESQKREGRIILSSTHTHTHTPFQKTPSSLPSCRIPAAFGSSPLSSSLSRVVVRVPPLCQRKKR